MIRRSYLKSRLHYNQLTGVWTWVSSPRAGWGGKVAGWDRNGYIVITIDQIDYTAHQLAWFYMTGRWPRFLIDHENNTKTDNRWRNLRSSNKTKNAQNGKRHKDNKCGFKGVWKLSDKPRPKPYAASIRVDGKTIWLGTYKRAKEAHQAYVKAAKEHFKEFARTA